MKPLYIIITSLLPILSFSQDLFTVKEININEDADFIFFKPQNTKSLEVKDIEKLI